jgi:hypothetical protein
MTILNPFVYQEIVEHGTCRVKGILSTLARLLT